MILVYILKKLYKNLFYVLALTNLSFSGCDPDITERLYIVLNGVHTSF